MKGSSDDAWPIVAMTLGLPLENVITANLFFESNKDVKVSLTMYTGKAAGPFIPEQVTKVFKLVIDERTIQK